MVCVKFVNVFVVALLAAAGIVDATQHLHARQAKGDDKCMFHHNRYDLRHFLCQRIHWHIVLLKHRH